MRAINWTWWKALLSQGAQHGPAWRWGHRRRRPGRAASSWFKTGIFTTQNSCSEIDRLWLWFNALRVGQCPNNAGIASLTGPYDRWPDWSLPMSKVFVNLRDDKIRWLKGNFRHSFFLCQDYFQKILLPLANETPISKGKNSINLREYFQHLTFSCEFNQLEPM